MWLVGLSDCVGAWMKLPIDSKIAENAENVIVCKLTSAVEAKAWVKQFGQLNSHGWIVRRTTSVEKYVYKGTYVCHHSDYHKKPALLDNRPDTVKKNTSCPASLVIMVKKSSKSKRRTDQYVKEGMFFAKIF